ncbi:MULTISPECIES: ImmA/IrrE family metallo-endopeptidase [Acinetobacter]|uniref:ImmA/IrrE family metallo-endopeptidase n=1 Tax=Acinetobacter TaxID=469 RepID=UPI000B3C016F|nr:MULTISPECIES: ImmA/IrrE family metallo-endopeptidase [Acinetobacter]AXY59272.1 ImmA/IrrE family metallo-endopeptidase [Acinetobacter sp. WCHAc010052]WOE42239.1 ImmA/IrrE family metallo-endopeptidase [Acinetobacter chinensis]
MVQKGPEYENFAFNYFTALIEQRYFGFPPNQCQLTPQKPFYSKDREKNIFFDLVLEIFLPQQLDPFLIFVIECKNYNHKVPVDDIEEFASKIDQIRFQKISPICITTVGFQSGGLTFAKNRGITLWKVIQAYENQEPEIVLNRQKKRIKLLEQEIKLALTDNTYRDWKFGNTFIQTPRKFTLYPKDYINEIISNENDKAIQLKNFNNQKINVPYLSKSKISLIAEDIYNQYKFNNGKLDIFKILNSFNISVFSTEEILDQATIAEINFSQKKITLFGKNYFSETQVNFALAHEIGHFLLGHDRYLKTERQTLNISKGIELRNSLPINLDRIEYQANYFAACLLLPETALTNTFISLIDKYNVTYRGFTLLYVDEQPCNLDNYNKICIPIANFFMVSQETLKIRLTELRLAKFNIKGKAKALDNIMLSTHLQL